jgi:hypothetical protein
MKKMAFSVMMTLVFCKTVVRDHSGDHGGKMIEENMTTDSVTEAAGLHNERVVVSADDVESRQMHEIRDQLASEVLMLEDLVDKKKEMLMRVFQGVCCGPPKEGGGCKSVCVGSEVCCPGDKCKASCS